MRDLVLNVPVFWVEQNLHIIVCTGVALVVFFAAHLIEYRYRFLLWLDAVALSAYSVFGAYKGLHVTGSPVVPAVAGAMTAARGGILRDVVAGEPTVISTKEIYVTAAAVGAAAFVAAVSTGVATPFAAAIGFFLAFAIRASALALGWSLPPYRSRPDLPIAHRSCS